jgi:hypothetical protein
VIKKGGPRPPKLVSFELPHKKLTMNKSTFFSGQPIFSQLLKFIPRDSTSRIALENKADYYCKRFSTYEHLVTMLYAIFNNCNSIREITTGMLASEQRLAHLGIRYYPRRSTIQTPITVDHLMFLEPSISCYLKNTGLFYRTTGANLPVFTFWTRQQ